MNSNNQSKVQEVDDNLNKSIETIKTQKLGKYLENLNRNLIKKLYDDLYIKNIALFQKKKFNFSKFPISLL